MKVPNTQEFVRRESAGKDSTEAEEGPSQSSLEVIPSQATPVYVEMASPEDKLLLDSIREAIKHWLDKKARSGTPLAADVTKEGIEGPPHQQPFEVSSSFSATDSGDSHDSSGSPTPLEFEIPSPLQRLLLHSLVSTEFPSLRSSSVKRGDRRFFVVYAYEDLLRERLSAERVFQQATLCEAFSLQFGTGRS